jgi:hypothetical protein
MTGQRSKQAALLGVFAILFQAILFGWHHHDLAFAARGAPLTLSAPASTGLPADDADECEICIVLHHQATAPLGFIAVLAGWTGRDRGAVAYRLPGAASISPG